MEEIRSSGLESITAGELQIRGGFSWIRAIKGLIRLGTAVKRFVNEYREEIERGFKRGWESI